MPFDITDTHPQYDRRRDQWQKVRDALEGEERVKERGVAYLPRPRGQKKPDYINYLTRASFYGVSDRTLRGLTGLVFRIEPTIELPARLEPLKESITSEGFSAMQMLREGTGETLSMGRYGILVDMPQSPSPTNTPYLATYKAEDIYRWDERFDPVRGRRMVTRVVVREEPEVEDDESTTLLRELFLDVTGAYRQRVWQKVTSEEGDSALLRASNEEIISGDYQIIDEFQPTIQGRPFDFIPFWFINVYDHRPRPQKPPFLDMVNMNLAHYRNSADFEQSLFLTGQPTPYVFGVPKEHKPSTMGSGTMWWSSSKEVNAGLLEFKGQGLNALRSAMLDKEERMAALGARLIKDFEPPENVASETLRLMNRSETSVLIAGVQTFEGGVEQALQFAAVWVGANPDDVNVTMNTDFIETRLAPEEITALVAGWQAGAYSKKTLHENLQKGEVIPPSRSIEEEQEMIDEEEPVGLPQPAPGNQPPPPDDENQPPSEE